MNGHGGVLMIAGEPSGDLHGAGVVRALREMRPALRVFGIGGDRMKAEGMEVVVHISEMSFMGFVEVVKNIGTVRRVSEQMKLLLDERKPDVVVLIDYPGFNLRFAKQAAARSIPVLYYISPQVWAWHGSRVKEMRKTITKMKVILPFEEAIYRNEGIDVEFVGHPLAEVLKTRRTKEQFFKEFGLDPRKKLLAVLPGSRLQEIHHIFPEALNAAARIVQDGQVQAAVGIAPNLGLAPFAEYRLNELGVTAIEGGTHDLMAYADAAIVTSGTATLETGWFGTPMVIVYRTSPITYLIGRMVIQVPFIGLVNIVAGKKLVPELIQGDCSAAEIERTIRPMLFDEAANAAVRSGLLSIASLLGGPGASGKVAHSILELVDAA
jgi:lipid-A-disaccharide synthase